jgi:hypothetical protein
MIELAIRQWVLETGSKEDALRFLSSVESASIEQVRHHCQELREYIASDSCGISDGGEEMEREWQELLSSPEAKWLSEGDKGPKEINGVDEEK